MYNAPIMKPVKIITHSGAFHADDVFAVATLLLLLGDTQTEIIRTRDKELFETADFVVDVGGVYDPSKKRFDHHQVTGAGAHENGVPFASFGLVWKEYGLQVASSIEIAELIESKIVMFVDAVDNGVDINKPLFEDFRPYTISDYLYSYWIDEQIKEEEIDTIFSQVVVLAKDLLVREIEKAKRIILESQLVEEIYNKTEDKEVVVLDQHLAWGKVLVEKPEPFFVVYPSIDGTRWNAKAVRVNSNSFECRKLFPLEWAGKMDTELCDASGVSDAVFCHRGRFLAVAKSKEGALQFVKKALTV